MHLKQTMAFNNLQLGHVGCICLFISLFLPIIGEAQYSIKVGTTASTFYYVGDMPIPDDGYDVDLRPYTGYDIAWVQASPQSPLFAWHLGISRLYTLTNKLNIEPEISFSQKGVAFRHRAYAAIHYRVKINYVEVPISLTYPYLQKDKSKGYIHCGVYGAYGINGIKRVTLTDASSYRTRLTSVKHFDAGIHLGIQYAYRIRGQYVSLQVRLIAGLCDVSEIPRDWTNLYYETHKTKNAGLQISIGYEI